MYNYGTVNKVILIGYIAKEPKKIVLPDGRSKVSFVIATQRQWVTKDDEIKTEIDWNNVVAYGPFADSIYSRALKRNYVYIEGRIKTRSWEDEKGSKKFITEIILDSETSKYQTLRKVKDVSEFNNEGDDQDQNASEKQEAILVDEIINMLNDDLHIIE